MKLLIQVYGPSLYALLFGLLLFCNSLVGQDKAVIPTNPLKFDTKTYNELSLSEWEKFKNFERQLGLDGLSAAEGDQRLRAYARDSLHILGVKLMAVKLLEEKKLLDRDIAENTKYYTALLDELRESSIPKTAYLFLEEKMAFSNQNILEQQLGRSRWLNWGLLALCLGLLFTVLHLKTKHPQTKAPALSKQERTVQNLILQGMSNKEIASELFISLSTVKSHITNIYTKLQVSGRRELLQKHTGTST